MLKKLGKSFRELLGKPKNSTPRYFISHSYADAAIRDQLISKLPADLEPFIFPPIMAKPDEFVSNRLVAAILDCDGLIYLRGGKSETSFWVAFERDYALRAGKPVYAADPVTLELTRDTNSPLDLAVFACYNRQERETVRKIANFLKRKRYFDMWFEATRGTAWAQEIKDSIVDRINRGGYVVVFWSEKASLSQFVRKEIALATEYQSAFKERVLFALLEDYPLPELASFYQEPVVQLYGDAVGSATHRLDDLVVRLYWLTYRKTKYSDWK